MSSFMYKQKKVNPFDTVVFADIAIIVSTSTYNLCVGGSFYVEPSLRKIVFLRSVIGMFAFVAFSFSAILVPITV